MSGVSPWALNRWPGAHVHCYEPLPDNFALLKKNLGQLDGKSVSLNNFAIGDPSLKRLYLGRNNCGEASFYDVGEQSTRPSRSRRGHRACCPRRKS